MPARKIENAETVVLAPQITDIGPDGAGPFELALTARYEPVIVERLGGLSAQLYLIHQTPTWVYAPSEPPAGAIPLYRKTADV